MLEIHRNLFDKRWHVIKWYKHLGMMYSSYETVAVCNSEDSAKAAMRLLSE